MEKYEDKKNNLLMSINGKTIFKIDNNFFIDNTGIRTLHSNRSLHIFSLYSIF